MSDSEHIPSPPEHSIERVDDGAPHGSAVLAMTGEFDLNCAAEFRSEIDAAAVDATDRVVVDLTEVQFMDSSMLKELLRANAELTAGGTRLVLVAPRAPVMRLFELTRTGELFTIVSDRQSALS